MPKGHENLTPFSERSREERSENGRKGGRASGEARRRKKALRLALKEAVALPLKDLPDGMRTAIMAAVGISDDSRTVGDAVIGGLIIAACNGSAPMVKILLDVLGESPDVRMKEREVKLKERAEKREHGEGADRGHLEDSPMVQLIQTINEARARRAKE